MRRTSKSQTGKHTPKSLLHNLIGQRVHVTFLDHGTFNDDPDTASVFKAEVMGWLHSETPDFIRVCTWRFNDDVADNNNTTAVIVKGAIKSLKILD
jgi:predicted lipoprotein